MDQKLVKWRGVDNGLFIINAMSECSHPLKEMRQRNISNVRTVTKTSNSDNVNQKEADKGVKRVFDIGVPMIDL